jgi:type II secretory pathway predicted ATPase ExeA
VYLEHFGLREAPFRITPHTEFFFSGAHRGATLEALIYAITHDEGIVKVSGEVGSGKTMLCRMLLERLPENVETVYLANPSLSRDEILFAVAAELQAPFPDGHPHLLMRNLQDRLLELYAAGRQVVVMIDEAHAMPAETLEEIRLLSNLESNRHKLLHIVLFGQPELDTRLAETGMRQLKERITHNFALEALRRSDIGDYLMFRIRAAGYRGPDLFTPRAIQMIDRASEGLTRRINILADKALLSAFSENKYQIDRRQIRAAIRDAQFNPMRERPSPKTLWVGGLMLVTAIGFSAYLAGGGKAPSEPLAAASTAQAASAPAPKPAPPAAPEKPAAAPAVAPAAIAPPPPAAAAPTTIAERVAATEAWLKTAPDEHYFIQLLSVDAANQREVENFIEHRTRALDAQQVRVYRSKLSGRERIGVIYGDFASLEEANAALAKVTKNNPESGPYVRAFSKLK